MDPWVEPLFELVFHWEFKCSQCKTPTKERVKKTLTSFTNISPDWRPLNAVHSAPCNVCSRKNGRRTMKLQRVPQVFGLHFVEGLPDNDVRNYTFTFKEKCYSVTICIQYNQQLKHFVTWIRNSDGSWLEYDGLKHPECETYQKLPVPAEEIHVVFWEVQEDKEPQACSPSSTFGESCLSQSEVNISPDSEDLIAEETFAHTQDPSLLASYNDTDILCALSTSADSNDDVDAAATGDASIGSTTLLDAFEGLTHSDIVTLTLVEIKDGSDEQIPDLNVPNRNGTIDSTPVSSSFVIGSEMSGAPRVETPATSNSSESGDGSSSDPTFVPDAKRRRGRSKPERRQMDQTEAWFDVAPHISSESPESNKIVGDESAAAAQDGVPDAERTRPLSPVSSTNTSPVATTQSLAATPMPVQDSCWSFLLGKHSLNQVGKAAEKVAPIPVMEVKPTHSTPNPLRRQPFPGGLPKPQLKTDKGERLPPKAAEMYDSFGIKSSGATSKGSSPALPPAGLNLGVKSKLLQPVPPNHQKPPVNNTGVSGRGLLPDVPSSRNRSSQSSRAPPGLSETDVLRYKLMKKLKAKKKKLAKLNEMLGPPGGASLRQDNTNQSSPTTVTSSTFDGSIGNDLLSELLSPATTASNLSPDSTGFLEVLASGREELGQLDLGMCAASQVNSPNHENFLEDFLSQAVARRPTEMETEALNALELFI